MNNSQRSDMIVSRKGCKDIWNAYMCKDAIYSRNDIPYCPTTAHTLPDNIILWDDAKSIYKKALARGDKEFHYNAFVCFYMDDYKFDGPRGIWHNSQSALNVIRHFAGAITPDFSTYQDFPEPLKIYNTFRMRVFGYWLGKNGISVINNVRWGTPESWNYCWDGIPRNSVVAIGTVGGNPKKLIDRNRFITGLQELVHVLEPHTILIYGSANYTCFRKLEEQGIQIISYPGRTASAFRRRQANE